MKGFLYRKKGSLLPLLNQMKYIPIQLQKNTFRYGLRLIDLENDTTNKTDHLILILIKDYPELM